MWEALPKRWINRRTPERTAVWQNCENKKRGRERKSSRPLFCYEQSILLQILLAQQAMASRKNERSRGWFYRNKQ